ncbi:MAG: glycosyltransferase family 4 protein [Candidatus Dormibacteraceae bacterium]
MGWNPVPGNSRPSDPPQSNARPQRRVLLDARILQGPSARRGIGSYARGLIDGLVAEGFGARLSLLVDARLPEPRLPSGCEVETVRRRYHGRFAAYEEAVALGSDLARIGPAAYHAMDLCLPGRSPCPVVVTLHDLIPWAWGGAATAGERIRHWPGRRLLARTDLVLAVSGATAQDAVRLAGVRRERIRIVHEGLDAGFAPMGGAGERVRARWGVQGPYLLYVGALDRRKDPGGLLTAWRAARQAGLEAELLLAGEPGPQAPRDMGGAIALGYVSEGDLADLYTAATCLLFPSRYEGFGLTVLQAMGCGCPVVAYRNSSLPEVMGEAGTLVTDGDAEALGHEAAVFADRGRRREAAEAGLRRAHSFTWQATARATIAAYRDVLR